MGLPQIHQGRNRQKFSKSSGINRDMHNMNDSKMAEILFKFCYYQEKEGRFRALMTDRGNCKHGY